MERVSSFFNHFGCSSRMDANTSYYSINWRNCCVASRNSYRTAASLISRYPFKIGTPSDLSEWRHRNRQENFESDLTGLWSEGWLAIWTLMTIGELVCFFYIFHAQEAFMASGKKRERKLAIFYKFGTAIRINSRFSQVAEFLRTGKIEKLIRMEVGLRGCFGGFPLLFSKWVRSPLFKFPHSSLVLFRLIHDFERCSYLHGFME